MELRVLEGSVRPHLTAGSWVEGLQHAHFQLCFMVQKTGHGYWEVSRCGWYCMYCSVM